MEHNFKSLVQNIRYEWHKVSPSAQTAQLYMSLKRGSRHKGIHGVASQE